MQEIGRRRNKKKSKTTLIKIQNNKEIEMEMQLRGRMQTSHIYWLGSIPNIRYINKVQCKKTLRKNTVNHYIEFREQVFFSSAYVIFTNELCIGYKANLSQTKE